MNWQGIWQTVQRTLTIAIFACITFILFSEQIVKQQIAICLLNAAFSFFCLWYSRTRNAGKILKDIYLGLGECFIIWRFLEPSRIAPLYFKINLAVLVLCYCIWEYKNRNNTRHLDKKEEYKLFPEHQADLERIKKLIQNNDMLGVQSPYGEGKSFVVDRLCADFMQNEKWNVIHIESLAYSYKDFDKVLIQKLFQVLKDNHIYSVYATELLQYIKETLWGKLSLSQLLHSSVESSSTFIGLKEDLLQLKKPVLIVFEDIERVQDPEYVKRLFAIAERLCSEKTKFILEYDASVLDGQGIDFQFREKYLPFEVNISDIPYRKLVSYLWEETEKAEYADLNKWEFEDYRNLPLLGDYGPLFLSLRPRHVEIEWDKIRGGNFSVRRVRNFLIESKLYLYQRKELSQAAKKIILKVLYLKFFYHDLFDKLKPGKSLEEVFLFKSKDDDKSLFEFCSYILKSKDPQGTFDELMENGQNFYSYYLFCFLGYEGYDYVKKIENEKKGEKPSKLNHTQHLQNREKRERINRIIWNLLMNGESEYSDQQLFMKRFVKEVLEAKSEVEQLENWERLQNQSLNEKIYKNNNGIIYFGVDLFVSLAQGMYVCSYQEKWPEFFQFYERIRKEIIVDVDLVKMLSFVGVQGEDNLLILAMDFFNKGKLIGNLNKELEYHKFLYEYIDCLGRWEYCQSLAPLELENWRVLGGFALTDERLLKILKQLKQDVKEKSEKKNNKRLTKELRVIQKFIQKNIDLMEMKNACPLPGPGIKTEVKTIYTHQKEIDMIDKMLQQYPGNSQALAECEQMMDEFYEKGKLTIYEFRSAQGWVKRKREHPNEK